jgi:undecaprenyl-diphosphatase
LVTDVVTGAVAGCVHRGVSDRLLAMKSLIVFVAQYGVIFCLLIAACVWLRLPWTRRFELAARALIGGAIGLALIALAGSLYYDPRPFAAHHGVSLFAHPADNGFPSDHVTLTMFVALCVLGYSRKWGALLIVISLLIGAARVAANVHSPIDIVGGVVVAGLAALIAFPLARRLLRYFPLGSPGGRNEGSS